MSDRVPFSRGGLPNRPAGIPVTPVPNLLSSATTRALAARSKQPQQGVQKPAGRDKPLPPARVDVPSPTEGMNGTEARRALELEALRLAGEIAAWWWEAFTFTLAPRTTYTPDFVIQERDGSLRVEETKGSFWRDDARAKTKIFAALFPFPTRVLQEKRKGQPWVIEDIKAQ